jgi:formylglycine-generating enzyme required for sulfatase activity
MKQNHKIFLCALLLVGAVSTMTAGAQNSGNKPTLAVFVVGMDNTLVSPLAAQLGANLTSGGKYTLTSVNTATKLAELQAAYNAGGGSSINRNALAEWGQKVGISAVCLVVDDVKGNDHMFSAQLIDAKDSKLSGKGNYIRTDVGSGDISRVALALAKQLERSGHRRSAPASVRTYPAELDIEMVFVEGGTFEMGCTAEQGNNCQSNWEVPAHTVTVSNFYIGKYQVTRAQWLAVMADHPTLSNPGTLNDDDQQPINNLTYNDITGTDGFLERLNALTDKKYRLATEAEWEYAARGGKHKSPYMYSGSNNVDEVAWYGENSGGKPHPVGGKKPNALGIYDMSGNICEFCSDRWSTSYYSTSNGAVNPKGPNDGSSYVLRGGNSGDVAVGGSMYHPRVASRRPASLNERQGWHGFRLALPAQ